MLAIVAYGVIQNGNHTEKKIVKHIPLAMPLPVAETITINAADLQCMAMNMYFESRDQSDNGMIAVGYVVLNRVASKHFPKSVCDVVYQGRKDADGNFIRNKCQFSWVCNGKKTHTPYETDEWERANKLAYAVLAGDVANPVGNSTQYHADYVHPSWRKEFLAVITIDSHIFYERK
jgi:spore germination cell wall hydrolase CwlJ-like protein